MFKFNRLNSEHLTHSQITELYEMTLIERFWVGLGIFLVLFLAVWFKYQLVNKRFTSESVQAFISGLLTNIKQYSTAFTVVILSILAVTFYIELKYLVSDNWWIAWAVRPCLLPLAME